MRKLLLILLLFFSFYHISFAYVTEEEKIRWHLLRTENVLRKVDTTNLTETQRINRFKNLDVLHRYALDGNFPNNDLFPGESRPFFRGSNGNLCAVGYLMYQDDDYKSYVDTIVETNNLVEVMDIKEGKIFDWLDENGFSQLEAAMIQPTYSCSMRYNDFICSILFSDNVFIISFLFTVFLFFGFKKYFEKIEARFKIKKTKYFIRGGICLIFIFIINSFFYHIQLFLISIFLG